MLFQREADLVAGNIQGCSGFKVLGRFDCTFTGQLCCNVAGIAAADSLFLIIS